MDEHFAVESSRVQSTFLDRIRKHNFILTQLSDKPAVQIFVVILNNLILLFCFVYHVVYAVLISLSVTRNDSRVWDMLGRWLTCASIAVSMMTAMAKYNVITKTSCEFYKHLQTARENRMKIINFPKATSFVLCGSLYVAFCLSIVGWAIFRAPFVPDRDVWVKLICSTGLCNFASLSEDAKNVIYSYDLFCYGLATVSPMVFINAVYCYSCLGFISLSKTASRHTRCLARKSNEVSGLSRQVILKSRMFCADMKIMLNLFNEIFSRILVITYGASLLCSCHFISRAIASTNHGGISIVEFSVYFICYGQSFIGVFIISWVSSKIPEMLNKIIIEMQSLTLNRDNVPLEVYAELNILFSQIETQPVGVSIGGFFLITRNFYVSYLGTIITFVVILAQFNWNG